MLSDFLNIIDGDWRTVLATVLTAGASAYVVSWIAFGRYRKEKVWDQKIREYNKLFDALIYMTESIDREFSNYRSGIESNNVETENLDKKHKVGESEIFRQTLIGEVFLPNEVINELKILNSNLNKHYNSNEYTEMIINKINSVHETLAALKKIARKDLVQPPFCMRNMQILKRIGAWKK